MGRDRERGRGGREGEEGGEEEEKERLGEGGERGGRGMRERTNTQGHPRKTKSPFNHQLQASQVQLYLNISMTVPVNELGSSLQRGTLSESIRRSLLY